MNTSSAPGKVILFGEHSVVYGKTGIATAVDLRTYVTTNAAERAGIGNVRHKDVWFYSKGQLEEIAKLYDSILKTENHGILNGHQYAHPVKYLTKKVFDQIGYRDLFILIKSKTPKGVGSSSSLACALTHALYSQVEQEIERTQLIELANHLDAIAHGGRPSGIDTTTITHGGYVSYSKPDGANPLNINYQIPLLIIETGQPSSTAAMVEKVSKHVTANPTATEEILSSMDAVATQAASALKEKDKEQLGRLMTTNQTLLRQLGVSTERIDDLIAHIIANHNIYGAKITGAGGGGSIIVLAENYPEIMGDLRKSGIRSHLVQTGVEGVRKE